MKYVYMLTGAGFAFALFMLVGVIAISTHFAHAATQGAPGLHLVETVDGVRKYYDQDADVICYTYYYKAISCIPHN